MELHHYNITSGDPYFIFEAQGAIQSISSCVIYNQASYCAALSSSGTVILIQIDSNSRQTVTFSSVSLIIHSIDNVLSSPMVSGYNSSGCLMFGQLNTTSLNFTQLASIAGPLFNQRTRIISPDQSVAIFYMLSADSSDNFMVVMKAQLINENFDVWGKKIQNLVLFYPIFVYSPQDGLFLIAGTNKNQNKFSIVRMNYEES